MNRSIYNRRTPKASHQNIVLWLIATSLVFLSFLANSAAASPKVVTTIAPVQSITAYIMGGTGTPQLLIPANVSPHDFAMKPSQAQLLSDADLVIWIGPELETFLEKSLSTIASKSAHLSLINTVGVKHLEPRTDAAFQGNHDHDHDHQHEEEAKIDPHIWLSLTNAKAMARTITEQLAQSDPDNKQTYLDNLNRLNEELELLISALSEQLRPLSGKPFLVYHDGFQYFENEFGLKAAGVFAINPDLRPGAKKLKQLATSLKEKNIVCVFSEPQFDPTPIKSLIAEQSGLNIKISELDPMGSRIEIDAQHYFKTMTEMANSFSNCLQ